MFVCFSAFTQEYWQDPHQTVKVNLKDNGRLCSSGSNLPGMRGTYNYYSLHIGFCIDKTSPLYNYVLENKDNLKLDDIAPKILALNPRYAFSCLTFTIYVGDNFIFKRTTDLETGNSSLSYFGYEGVIDEARKMAQRENILENVGF